MRGKRKRKGVGREEKSEENEEGWRGGEGGEKENGEEDRVGKRKS